MKVPGYISHVKKALAYWNGVVQYDKCIKDYHTAKVHSVVLMQTQDERLLRMYIALPANHLYKNDPDREEIMSVGFHNHRYDLSLFVVKGTLTNHSVQVADTGNTYRRYCYRSGMKENQSATFKFDRHVDVSNYNKQVLK